MPALLEVNSRDNRAGEWDRIPLVLPPLLLSSEVGGRSVVFS